MVPVASPFVSASGGAWLAVGLLVAIGRKDYWAVAAFLYRVISHNLARASLGVAPMPLVPISFGM